MVVVEHAGPVAFDIVGPDCSLRKGVALSVSERVQSFNQLVHFIARSGALGVGEVVVGDLGDQHVAFVPPGLGGY